MNSEKSKYLVKIYEYKWIVLFIPLYVACMKMFLELF